MSAASLPPSRWRRWLASDLSSWTRLVTELGIQEN